MYANRIDAFVAAGCLFIGAVQFFPFAIFFDMDNEQGFEANSRYVFQEYR